MDTLSGALTEAEVRDAPATFRFRFAPMRDRSTSSPGRRSEIRVLPRSIAPIPDRHSPRVFAERIWSPSETPKLEIGPSRLLPPSHVRGGFEGGGEKRIAPRRRGPLDDRNAIIGGRSIAVRFPGGARRSPFATACLFPFSSRGRRTKGQKIANTSIRGAIDPSRGVRRGRPHSPPVRSPTPVGQSALIYRKLYTQLSI